MKWVQQLASGELVHEWEVGADVWRGGKVREGLGGGLFRSSSFRSFQFWCMEWTALMMPANAGMVMDGCLGCLKGAQPDQVWCQSLSWDLWVRTAVKY